MLNDVRMYNLLWLKYLVKAEPVYQKALQRPKMFILTSLSMFEK